MCGVELTPRLSLPWEASGKWLVYADGDGLRRSHCYAASLVEERVSVFLDIGTGADSKTLEIPMSRSCVYDYLHKAAYIYYLRC